MNELPKVNDDRTPCPICGNVALQLKRHTSRSFSKDGKTISYYESTTVCLGPKCGSEYVTLEQSRANQASINVAKVNWRALPLGVVRYE